MAEAIRRTGLDARTCSNTAAYLRRAGVPLPHMPRPNQLEREENLTPEEIMELKRLVLS